MENERDYAVLGYTEHYSGGDDWRLVSLEHATREEAEAAAEAWNPDYDPGYGCTVLGHNQAAAECGRVGEILYVGDQSPLDDWTLLPGAVEAALTQRGRELLAEDREAEDDEDEEADEEAAALRVSEDSEAMLGVLAEHGLYIVGFEDDPEIYLVRIL